MPRMYDTCLAKCPFFISSGRKNIQCEGMTDNCSITLMFVSEEARNIFRRAYCNTCYKNCTVYNMVMAKYEE